MPWRASPRRQVFASPVNSAHAMISPFIPCYILISWLDR
jgi:hypothetical protein